MEDIQKKLIQNMIKTYYNVSVTHTHIYITSEWTSEHIETVIILTFMKRPTLQVPLSPLKNF